LPQGRLNDEDKLKGWSDASSVEKGSAIGRKIPVNKMIGTLWQAAILELLTMA
jgi:hypothetical protein